jgi:hypothetical protein
VPGIAGHVPPGHQIYIDVIEPYSPPPPPPPPSPAPHQPPHCGPPLPRERCSARHFTGQGTRTGGAPRVNVATEFFGEHASAIVADYFKRDDDRLEHASAIVAD